MTRLGRHAVRKILLALQDEGLIRLGYGRLTLRGPDHLKAKLDALAGRDQKK